MARKGPVVRHNKKTEETKAINRILKNFYEEMLKVGHDAVVKGNIKKNELSMNIDNVEGDTLLELRKKLALTIKSGMLERKDKEPEIAIYAALVWFMRLAKSRRDRILEEWG